MAVKLVSLTDRKIASLKAHLEYPLWDAPRIHGELLKLGIDIGEDGSYVGSVAHVVKKDTSPRGVLAEIPTW